MHQRHPPYGLEPDTTDAGEVAQGTPQAYRAGLAIDRFRANGAQKRYDGMEVLLSELDDCVPAETNVERQIEETEIAESVEYWLDSLKPEDRALFIRRYWYGDEVKELAELLTSYGVLGDDPAERYDFGMLENVFETY